MSDCCRCGIEVDTPDSLLNTDDPTLSVDVFETSVPEGTNKAAFTYALWRTYRYRMIGSCDTDYWLQNLKDKCEIINDEYNEMMEVFLDNAVIRKELYDLGLTITESGTAERTDSSTGTNTLVRTTGDETSSSGTDTNNLANSRQSLTENENLPQLLTGTDKYLSGRTNVNESGTDTGTVQRTGTSQTSATQNDRIEDTKSGTGSDTTSKNTRQLGNHELGSVLFKKFLSAYESPLAKYVKEFDGLFLNRW